jgi:hypothetical protein
MQARVRRTHVRRVTKSGPEEKISPRAAVGLYDSTLLERRWCLGLDLGYGAQDAAGLVGKALTKGLRSGIICIVARPLYN